MKKANQSDYEFLTKQENEIKEYTRIIKEKEDLLHFEINQKPDEYESEQNRKKHHKEFFLYSLNKAWENGDLDTETYQSYKQLINLM